MAAFKPSKPSLIPPSVSQPKKPSILPVVKSSLASNSSTTKNKGKMGSYVRFLDVDANEERIDDSVKIHRPTDIEETHRIHHRLMSPPPLAPKVGMNKNQVLKMMTHQPLQQELNLPSIYQHNRATETRKANQVTEREPIDISIDHQASKNKKFYRLHELSNKLDRVKWPIRVRRMVDLTELLQLDRKYFISRPNTITIQSNQYVCVRDAVDHARLIVVDINDLKNMICLNVSVDDAIMHLNKKIIAIKIKRMLQIVDLNENRKLKEFELENDEFLFWKWINYKSLAIISSKSIYHWNLFDSINNERPVKQFDLDQRLNGYRIVNYLVSPDEKCFIIIGLKSNGTVPGPGHQKQASNSGESMIGRMQMSWIDNRAGNNFLQTQIMEGHAACFAKLKNESSIGNIANNLASVNKSYDGLQPDTSGSVDSLDLLAFAMGFSNKEQPLSNRDQTKSFASVYLSSSNNDASSLNSDVADDTVTGKLHIVEVEPSSSTIGNTTFDAPVSDEDEIESTVGTNKKFKNKCVNILFNETPLIPNTSKNVKQSKAAHQGKNNLNTKQPTRQFHRDYPFSIHYCDRYGIFFLLTKSAILHIYEAQTGELIFVHNLAISITETRDELEFINEASSSIEDLIQDNNFFQSRAPVKTDFKFIATVQNNPIEMNKVSSGFVGIYENGLVVTVEIDEQSLMYYLVNYLNLPRLAYTIASRCSLTNVDQLLLDKFEAYFQMKNYVQAALVVASSPQLRTPKIIDRFRLEQITNKEKADTDGSMSNDQASGSKSAKIMPLLQYFHTLLQSSPTERLNKYESIELCKLILNKNKEDLIKKLLNENRIDLSEELGDLLKENGEYSLSLLVYTSEPVQQLYGNEPQSTAYLIHNNKAFSPVMTVNPSSTPLTLGQASSLGRQPTRRSTTRSSFSISKYIAFINKIIECFIRLEKFDSLLEYLQKINYEIEFSLLLKECFRLNKNSANKDACIEFAKILATRKVTRAIQSIPSEFPNSSRTIESTNYVVKTLVDLKEIVYLFCERGLFRDCTKFLLDIHNYYLKEEKMSDAELKQLTGSSYEEMETKLLEINVINAPQIANALLEANEFKQYNRQYIGELCERVGLYQRALENYSRINDIKRCITKTDILNADWLVDWYWPRIKFSGNGQLDQLILLDELLKVNINANLSLVIQIAMKYHEQIGIKELVRLFEKYKLVSAIFFLLDSVLDRLTDPDLNFTYIKAACKLNKQKELEKICRESNYYEPERVKNFLIKLEFVAVSDTFNVTQLNNEHVCRLTNPLPLIIVCDRFGYINDMVAYLYKNYSLSKYIQYYMTNMNQSQIPKVFEALMDLENDENKKLRVDDVYVKLLLEQVKDLNFDFSNLIEQFEKRPSYMRLLLEWLEYKVYKQNSNDIRVNNQLAKIYIDASISMTKKEQLKEQNQGKETIESKNYLNLKDNKKVEKFLRNSRFYDFRQTGKYCESKSEPYLASLCYEAGQCDDEMLKMCQDKNLLKLKAVYLIRRNDIHLWHRVLDQKPRDLIDLIVNSCVFLELNSHKSSSSQSSFSFKLEWLKKTINAFFEAYLIDDLKQLTKNALNNKKLMRSTYLQTMLVFCLIKLNIEFKDNLIECVTFLDLYEPTECVKYSLENNLEDVSLLIINKYDLKTANETFKAANSNGLLSPRQPEQDNVTKLYLQTLPKKSQLETNKKVKNPLVDSTTFQKLNQAAKPTDPASKILNQLSLDLSSVSLVASLSVSASSMTKSTSSSMTSTSSSSLSDCHSKSPLSSCSSFDEIDLNDLTSPTFKEVLIKRQQSSAKKSKKRSIQIKEIYNGDHLKEAIALLNKFDLNKLKERELSDLIDTILVNALKFKQKNPKELISLLDKFHACIIRNFLKDKTSKKHVETINRLNIEKAFMLACQIDGRSAQDKDTSERQFGIYLPAINEYKTFMVQIFNESQNMGEDFKAGIGDELQGRLLSELIMDVSEPNQTKTEKKLSRHKDYVHIALIVLYNLSSDWLNLIDSYCSLVRHDVFIKSKRKNLIENSLISINEIIDIIDQNISDDKMLGDLFAICFDKKQLGLAKLTLIKLLLIKNYSDLEDVPSSGEMLNEDRVMKILHEFKVRYYFSSKRPFANDYVDLVMSLLEKLIINNNPEHDQLLQLKLKCELLGLNPRTENWSEELTERAEIEKLAVCQELLNYGPGQFGYIKKFFIDLGDYYTLVYFILKNWDQIDWSFDHHNELKGYFTHLNCRGFKKHNELAYKSLFAYYNHLSDETKDVETMHDLIKLHSPYLDDARLINFYIDSLDTYGSHFRDSKQQKTISSKATSSDVVSSQNKENDFDVKKFIKFFKYYFELRKQNLEQEAHNELVMTDTVRSLLESESASSDTSDNFSQSGKTSRKPDPRISSIWRENTTNDKTAKKQQSENKANYETLLDDDDNDNLLNQKTNRTYIIIRDQDPEGKERRRRVDETAELRLVNQALNRIYSDEKTWEQS